jgi:hypothetical protein
MTKKKKAGLWDRTKDVATTYTGTFIVVMLLWQGLFWGLCLNPICIIAAMPVVLLITVFVGSILNRIGRWGERGLAKKTLQAVGKKLDDVGEIFESASEEILESSKKHNETLRTAQYKQSMDSLRELQDLQVKYKNNKAELARRAKDRTKDVEFKDDEGTAQKNFNQANRYSKKGNEWEALANLNKNFGATPSKKVAEFLEEHKANHKRSAQENFNQANEKEALESSDTEEESKDTLSVPRKKIIEFLEEHKANHKRKREGI